MALAPLFTKTVWLNGITRTGAPIERCHGEYKEIWLLMPGTGVHFLVDRTRIYPLARHPDVRATQDPGAPV